ncbi:hypothetical protein IWW38_000949 [Coemansia aciculifera]|uniref:Uncharacterized protein n=1 Tax=Coemansia aciculifera TaxID=417176 RepID=A0ACC1M8N9_9FUNG|nr:hypothetical protein IWW38_000949 [Coemansia aciculifera]
MKQQPDYIKLVEPYIQRAQEISAVDPVVSYFCKYHAARIAIASAATTGGSGSGEEDTFLAQLLDQLEAEKQRIADSPHMQDDTTASQHVLGFALRVFAKADTEDREGRASKATARTFIVASQFLQILSSFGNGGGVTEDVAEKIKYAKWRAAEILKAAREGRLSSPPPPGPAPAAAAAAAVQSPPPADVLGWPSPPTTATTAAAASFPHQPSPPPLPAASESPAFVPVLAANLPPPPPPPPLLSQPLSPSSTPALDPDQMLDPVVAKKAQKLARWAISALEYDDVNNAIENLREAIKVLTPFSNPQ